MEIFFVQLALKCQKYAWASGKQHDKGKPKALGPKQQHHPNLISKIIVQMIAYQLQKRKMETLEFRMHLGFTCDLLLTFRMILPSLFHELAMLITFTFIFRPHILLHSTLFSHIPDHHTRNRFFATFLLTKIPQEEELRRSYRK